MIVINIIAARRNEAVAKVVEMRLDEMSSGWEEAEDDCVSEPLFFLQFFLLTTFMKSLIVSKSLTRCILVVIYEI